MAHLTKANKDGKKCSLVRGGDNGAVCGVRPDRELVHPEERAAVRGGCDYRDLGIQCSQDPDQLTIPWRSALYYSCAHGRSHWWWLWLILSCWLLWWMALATPMRGILIEMAQNIKKLTARFIGTLIFLIDGQNMRKLTARVIRLRPTPEETILQDFIPDHNNQLEIIEMILNMFIIVIVRKWLKLARLELHPKCWQQF